MTKVRKLKLDWLNHVVGFFSALLGIYIAFRLENYREDKKEKEKVEIVKQVLKKEIENNLKIYKTNVDSLSSWLEYKDFFEKKMDRKKHGLVVGVVELSHITKKQPAHRFSSLKEIRSINDTLKVYELDFLVDVAPVTGISTSNWKTAVASGILNSMDYAITTRLSQIYDWTEKDIGTSEEELFENFLGINNSTNNNFADYNKMVIHYANLSKVHSLKYDKIERIYSEIVWDKP